MDYKEKLSDDWFEPDQLVLLESGFNKIITKKIMKDLLDEVGIKWTVRYKTPGITKIVARKSWWYDSTEKGKFLKSHSNNMIHPKDLKRMIDNLSATDMTEYTRQVLSLLKTMEETNIVMAVKMIDNSLIENNWLPWLMINKEIPCVRELLQNRGISLGQFRVPNTRQNFWRAVNDLQSRLKINDDYLNEFMVDFYKAIK